MPPALVLPLVALAGYLLGAIPSGVIVGGLRGIDLRRSGSGRTGTTNALRALGPAGAATVLVMDVVKGAAAVLVARAVAEAAGGDAGLVAWSAALAGAAAVVGHVRSIFIAFAGGRGVATGAGALLAVAPLGLLAALPVFATVVLLTRYVSLGSVLAAVTVPLATATLLTIGRADLAALTGAVAIAVVVVLAHRDNLERLRAGTERRLGGGADG